MVGTPQRPRPRRGNRLALSFAALAALLPAACGGSVTDDLAKLKSSAPPDIYYLGESFEGEKLTHVESRGFFAYGTCDPGPDSGCAPPVQIQHHEFQPRMWEIAHGCRRAGTIRGVPAVHHDSLIALTRGAFVKIYATSEAQTQRAFKQLRSVDGTVGPGEPLPKARPGVIRAVLRACPPR
jgi:hypothetical protein